MAGTACGFSALVDRLQLLRRQGAGRCHRRHAGCAARPGTAPCGPGGHPIGRDHRLPIDQSRRNRGPGQSRGYDAGKKISGRKRHIVTDTLGLLLCVAVNATSVQDRDAGRAVLRQLAASFQRIRLVWADGGNAGKLVTWATHALKLTM